jgi:hypothetical protein
VIVERAFVDAADLDISRNQLDAREGLTARGKAQPAPLRVVGFHN